MGKTSPSGRDLDQPSSLLHLIFFEHAGIVIFWFIDPFGDSSYAAMKLHSFEVELVGKWLVENNQIRSDATCERIQWLTTHHLLKIATSKQAGDWETLFQDPDDGRFWERTYPQGEMQGGGPPRLATLSREQAQASYGLKM